MRSVQMVRGLAVRRNESLEEEGPLHWFEAASLDEKRVVLLLPAASAADAHGLITFSSKTLARLTDFVSFRLLAPYVYSRAPLAHHLALVLLQTALRHMEFATRSDELARLADWFLLKTPKRALSAWWVINQVVDLLYQLLGNTELYAFGNREESVFLVRILRLFCLNY